MPSDDLSDRLAKLGPAQRAVYDRVLAARSAGPVPPRTSAESDLVRIWQEVLKKDVVGVRDSFFALGGDSITSLQVSARASAAGIRVTSRQVLEAETVERLAELASRAPEPVGRAADEPSGEVPLTPIQRWFFEQRVPRAHQWDQTIFVELADAVDASRLRAALAAVVEHHDVLRSTFSTTGDGWRHVVGAECAPPSLEVVDLALRTPETQDPAIREETVRAQEAIDLARGPLLTAVLFRLAPARADRLLLVVHHLVVDGVSLRILVEDLDTAYAGLRGGDAAPLPAKTTSFRGWGEALQHYARDGDLLRQADYWRSVPDPEAASPWTCRRGTEVRNTAGRGATATFEVDPGVVRALRGEAVRAGGASPLHLLLASFALAWRSRTGRNAVQVDLERHGREHIADGVDVSRTVGWFTSIHPVVLHVPETARAEQVVDAVRRQFDRIPDRGIGYGVLRHLTTGIGAELAALPRSAVSFNFLGWFDRPSDGRSLFGAPVQAPAQLLSPDTPRPYLLDVVITGIEQRLLVELTYATDAYPADEVDALGRELVTALGELVDLHSSKGASRELRSSGVAGDRLADVVRQVGINR